MKNSITLLLLTLLIGGCKQEPQAERMPKEGELLTVSFGVDISDEQVNTRAMDETTISNMFLVVFDESGNFITRVAATFTGTTFSANLPYSSNRRTIHFIANYDWTGFSDSAAAGKNEGELIAPLASSSLIFWQRVVLPSGIFATAFSSQTVSLIRNMAKVALVNNATSTFTNAAFALYNKPTSGTVAPFNTTAWRFDGTISEPTNASVSATPDPLGTDPLYTFERYNSSAGSSRTFAILRGTYAGATYYYKLDLINSSNQIYDLKRNNLYTIRVQSVSGTGYTTLAAAVSGAPSNNLWASVELSGLSTVDNGTYALSVTPLSASFISDGQTLNSTAIYYLMSNRVTQNSSISVTLNQNSAAPVVNGAVNYNTSTGAITASINNVPTDGSVRTATIVVSAGGLSRTINLTLGNPYLFTNVGFTPSSISGAVSTATTLKFTVPLEAESLLPLVCNIYTNYLLPVSYTNLTFTQENGLFVYKWIANSVGEQTIDFKTSIINASESVVLSAFRFAPASAIYTNTSNVYRFSNAYTTPSYVPFGIGQPVTLTFSVPTAGTYKILTNNLNPVVGTIAGGVYSYTATSAGIQNVKFTTNKAYVTETITLQGASGSGYIDYKFPLRSQLVQLSGKLTFGNSASILGSKDVTMSIGSSVAGIISTGSLGEYSAIINAKIGDILIFSYQEYTSAVTITGTPMVINTNLLR